MARITTTFTPTIIPFPFRTGDDDAIGMKPSAAITAVVLSAAVAASGANDNQAVRIDLALPPNFSYVITDLMAKINVAAAANTWDDIGMISYLDASDTEFRTTEYGIEMLSQGQIEASTVRLKIFTPTGLLPSFQMIPPVGGAVGAFLQGFWENSTDQQAAATFSFTARFLQYTVAQAYDVDVNTPLLIR